MKHCEALGIIVRSQSIGLILLCVKAGKEVTHNLNSDQNVAELIYYYL